MKYEVCIISTGEVRGIYSSKNQANRVARHIMQIEGRSVRVSEVKQ